MPVIHSGDLSADELSFGIVVSRFNEFVTGKLLDGALDCLSRHGCRPENIEIAWVPGTFEIPLVAKTMAARPGFDAVICIGALIRGETPHFDFIAAEVTKGVAQVAMESSKPVIFGVITTDNLEQAIDRAGTKGGNKGRDAAEAAIEMANLLRGLSRS
ncbi:MAG: 6,7-dimethyl-8-ribityllumazine synthase [Firmicutes bacterium]|nr:6,7-dimethyl-8-ribityllumazine synthase [Bacillota bacterium]